jgi:hypothetical protein
MTDAVRLYLDEDSMRAGIVRALRARQVDVITAQDADLVGRHSDEEHVAYATEHGRVVFTFNRGDFARLHKTYIASGRHHAGIILSDQLETSMIVRRLFRLLAELSAADMYDRLINYSPQRPPPIP